jgi:hypothetical protein
MRYSLLSRFAGGILGSYLGDYLFQVQKGRVIPPQISPWQAVALAGCRSLRDRRTLDWQDWQKRIASVEFLPKEHQEQKILTTEFTIAMLPLILFFHDHANLLRRHLTQIAQTWLPAQVDLDEVFLWVNWMILALTEKLSSRQMLVQTPAGQLREELTQTQTYLQDFASLEQVAARVSHPLALALYCFRSTPDDFRLGLMRASRSGNSQVMILVGALSGVYNTESGIPLSWRFRYAHPPDRDDPALLAQGLFGAWSGMYQVDPSASHLQEIAIAPTGLIQFRSSLRLISRQE